VGVPLPLLAGPAGTARADEQHTGATKSVTFTLTNAGGKASGPLRITLSGSSAFTISSNRCSGRSLGPNKSCTVPVEYAPKSSGQSASATLAASGKSARTSLTLSGQGGVGGTPNLTLSPGKLTGTINGTNSYIYFYPSSIHVTQTFTVTNSGTSSSETLLIECNGSPSQGSCPYPFTLNHDTCTNTSLAANGNGRGAPRAEAFPKIGVPAPDFSLPDLSGKMVALSDYQGSQTLLLFWRPSCGFCQRMLEDLKVWEAHRPTGAPKLLVVSTDSVESNQAMGMRSPVLLEQGNMSVGRLFGATGTPMAVLVDEAGKIASELAAGAPAVLALAGVHQEQPSGRPR
jgi:thiol-disulfide isomerase/thioredoxin